MEEITDKRMLDPLHMLKEIEAYLTFRLLGENPEVSKEEMKSIRDDLKICLRHNGAEV